MKYFKLFFFSLVFLVMSQKVGSAGLPAYDAQGKIMPSLSTMLKRVNPAVVNISTYSTQTYRSNPLLSDPFFRHFFNLPDQEQFGQKAPQRREQSAGSGVVVDADDGIVMTNYHVIKNADEVHVSLIDGRTFKATIVGTDPELDIAILDIDADDLSQIEMADSSELEVGDFVIAIGNPFGLGQTVTTGIVSALGRSGLGIEGYENFIQTDASINPGNSGGALVDLNGGLVGINTAIIAPAGGNVGIGFAIPANMAKASMSQIIAHGEVKRGQIGIGIQNITGDLRDAFNLESGQSGVLISHVGDDTPAQKAGLKTGDIVLEVDGKPTRSSGQLKSQIGMKGIGETVELTLFRNGERKLVRVKVGTPQQLATVDRDFHKLFEGARFENTPGGQGVTITSLSSNSPAARSGLQVRDIIISVNRQAVNDIESFKKALKRSQKSVLLHVNRNEGSLFLVIR